MSDQAAVSTPVNNQAQPDSSTNASQSAAAAGSAVTAATTSQASRPTTEASKRDKTLAEFMLMLDDYEPLIPNEVTDYYLQRVGFECEDVRLKRLLSLAAQKFVSDIAADAFQHARIRTNATPSSRARYDKTPIPGVASTSTGKIDKSKTVLTMDDLSSALAEYGINARKPEFFL